MHEARGKRMARPVHDSERMLTMIDRLHEIWARELDERRKSLVYLTAMLGAAAIVIVAVAIAI